ncbi:MAG TPA: heparan-alpha-glucosaminide N-acetyltransferase domain-containing protein [Isosphaeraceae bacterium]|jgi:uncharacterized membrane protein|nr:heparan-alpha-glucosaminide N-acetyltransferase domain-containing protein [Isosphaeraceae bacterium]
MSALSSNTLTADPPGAAFSGTVRPRLDSVDLLRGLVMVLMVLDHVRDFFSNATINPTDLTQTTPALFFTRWITHFCAPVFIFLAGTGAFLAGARGKSKLELAGFLLTRGLWIVLLALTAEKLGLTFGTNPRFFIAVTLWAIGWSMVVLAGLVFLPTPVIGALGIVVIATHNLLDGVQVPPQAPFAPLWAILHQPGAAQLPGHVTLFVAYPLIPWFAVMAAGYTFGTILLLNPKRRQRMLVGLGLGLTLAFIAIRATNLYGDPQPWAIQKNPLYTVMSFLNCTKYPPSLLFLLMTLGPAILALAVFDRGVGPLGRPLITLGRVPMFYYLLQWPVAHGLAILLELVQGRTAEWLIGGISFGAPPGHGHGLGVVYLMWWVVVLLLYPACRWYAAFKQRRRDVWLSYL